MIKQTQQGFSLLSLVFWGAILGAALLIGLKTVPIINENLTLKKAISYTKNAGDAAQIKEAFGKYMSANYAQDFSVDDLIIERQNGKMVIGYDYQRKIGLVGPVSLLFEFRGAEAASQ